MVLTRRPRERAQGMGIDLYAAGRLAWKRLAQLDLRAEVVGEIQHLRRRTRSARSGCAYIHQLEEDGPYKRGPRVRMCEAEWWGPRVCVREGCICKGAAWQESGRGVGPRRGVLAQVQRFVFFFSFPIFYFDLQISNPNPS
jgi:hypothetical protein